jgi:glyoxylase-like metal-dependent hydrolase (beta-lactamase superfamily II)
MIDRRQFVQGVVGGLLGSLAVPRHAAAVQADTAQQTTLTPLDDRLFLLTSGGTNVLALSTSDGLVLTDSGAPELSEPLMASLRQLSSNSGIPTVFTRIVFNTHWHPENTGGNEVLRQGGATIVAHENTRLWMATPVWIPSEDRYRPPRPKPAQPDRTFYLDGSMNEGGERVDYGYLIDAHTSGDIYVFFRGANVLAVGDVAAPVRDPELDYWTGAWIGGRVDAMDRLLALGDDNTRIVPGYGPVMSRADLRAERDVMKVIYDRTVERVRQGDYVDDMLKAGVMNGLARTWNDPRRFLHDVHKGLWAHHNKLSPDVV